MTDRTIKKIITVNGGKFNARIVANFMNDNFIKHVFTILDHQQTNGVTERYNQTILNCIRAVLFETGLDHSLWGKVGVAHTYIHNRTLIYKGMSLIHRITTREPIIHHLQTLGFSVFGRIQNQTDKMEKMGSPLMKVGYHSKH
jgi:hypothetical protein